MATETILITGGVGFLGRHLVKRFVADGMNVAILKRSTSKIDHIAEVLDSVHVFDVDFLDEAFITLGRVDIVMHTATNYGRRNEPLSKVFETNTVLPLRLLETSIRYGVRAFINADTVLDPSLNAYSLSKFQFKQWAKRLALDGGFRFINLRLEQVYGSGDDTTKFTSHVILACLNNVPQLKLSLGEQKRDFIHVSDIVEAYVIVIDRLLEFSLGYSELDVGSGKAVTVREFVETVHRLTNSATQLEFGAIPYRPNEPMFSKANTARLRSLGWMNRYDLATGLKQSIQGEQSSLRGFRTMRESI